MKDNLYINRLFSFQDIFSWEACMGVLVEAFNTSLIKKLLFRNQGVIFSDSLISHGRLSFTNIAYQRR